MKMQPRSDDCSNESQGLRRETTDESLVCLTLRKLTHKLLFAGDSIVVMVVKLTACVSADGLAK